MSEGPERDRNKGVQENSFNAVKPIEPEKTKITKLYVLKWLFFSFFLLYILISYFHVPILFAVGRYLIKEHSPEKSDLLVCLAGGNIERGLATADAFKDGLAPQIFIAREELPDGYSLLKERGVSYPEGVDLLIRLFKSLGIPESAILTSDTRVRSTMDEARLVRKEAEERGLTSLIILTSPIHSRRAWLTYKEVFKDTNIRILMLPSKYSQFSPKDWWKKRKYIREVIIEYEKLIYYTLRYFSIDLNLEASPQFGMMEIWVLGN